jgi:hypothetical protein
MTKDEILEMANHAGFERLGVYAQFGDDWVCFTEELIEFAKLVAAKERDACAKVCEDNAIDLSEGDWDPACINCADHIRARGQA